MPLRVHPEASSWEFRGPPNVDSLRLRVKDPTADYWTFQGTNPDYLTQNDGRGAEFCAPGDFTVMVRLRLSSAPSNQDVIHKYGSTGGTYSWSIMFNIPGALYCRVSLDGTNWISCIAGYTHPGSADEVLVALVYEVATNTLRAYVINSTTTSTNSTDAAGGGTPVHSDAAPVILAARLGLGGNEWNDRIYWWAYTEQALSQSDLEAVFANADTHPMDFGCKCYDDFNDTVGASHETLIGGYTFTVTGSPTHTGDQGPSWPDPSRLFEPNRWGDDFTIMGVFEPGSISGTYAIVGKWNEDGVNAKCWQVQQVNTQLQCLISKDGSTQRNGVQGSLTVGQRAFFCMRYQYNGDGDFDTQLHFDVNGAGGQTNYQDGPIFKSNLADFQIADFDDTVDRQLDGKIYWLAYWNRKLTDTEMDNIYQGLVKPQQYNPDWYDDFHDAVAATKESTIPGDDTYNPGWIHEGIVFDVEGSPTQSGDTESSADTYVEGPVSPLENAGEMVGVSLSSTPERTYPKVSEQALGEASPLDGGFFEDLQILSRSQIPERTYPKTSEQDLGGVSVFRVKPEGGSS